MRAEIKALIAILVVIILAVLIYCAPTFAGLYRLRVSHWEEEEFEGRPLMELQLFLHEKNIHIGGADPNVIFPRNLQPNQGIYQFTKGDEYRWFIGKAVNVCYIIVEKRGDSEIIIEFRRGKSVDAL